MQNVYTDSKPGMPGRYLSIRALDMDTVEAQTVLPKNPKEHGQRRVKSGFYANGRKFTISAAKFAKDVDSGYYESCVVLTDS